jgi:hypothetical protein
MNSTSAVFLCPLCLLFGCSAPTATRTSTGQVGGAALTAVYSRASKDYVRTQLPDGSFKPESYALKSGGNFGGPRVDPTMDAMTFDDISRVIEPSLATQNFVPADDAAGTDLLIMVYWGKTIVPQDVDPRENRESVRLREMAANSVNGKSMLIDAAIDEAMEAKVDGQVDAKSANILGFTEEIFRTSPRDPRMMTLQDEIEENRYYVVLLAYDFQAARRQQHKLLWETRFSIPERGNDFEKAFPLMASIAATFFGQDSHGLIHHNLADPHVEIGVPKSLGTVPER